MRVRYVGDNTAANGWCDHCDNPAEFVTDRGIKNVGTKRLCEGHARELMGGLSDALHQKRVVEWQARPVRSSQPKRSG